MVIQDTKHATPDLNGSITARITALYNTALTLDENINHIQKELKNTGLDKTLNYIRTVVYRIRQRTQTPARIEQITGTTPGTTPVTTTPEQTALIPGNNGYIDTNGYAEDIIKAHYYNLTASAQTEKVNVLLTGHTGTGKTELGKHVAFKLKLPLYNATFNGETSTDNILGTKELIKDTDGQTRVIWRDGIVTKAVRYGGVLLLDEFNAIHPSIGFNFFSLMGRSRELILYENGGERVKAHPNLLIIATQNNGYAGTNDVNIALLNRCCLKINMDYCTATEKKLVKNGLIYNEQLLNFARKQRDAFKLEKYSVPISTRDLITFTTLIKLYGTENALNYFLNNFQSEEERISIKTLYELEVLNKDGQTQTVGTSEK